MSKPKKDKFYLVQEDILPEAIKKTIKVKEILKLGEVKTINEAVEKMDLSRSAYYKYKDYVFPFFEIDQGKIVSICQMNLVCYQAFWKPLLNVTVVF